MGTWVPNWGPTWPQCSWGQKNQIEQELTASYLVQVQVDEESFHPLPTLGAISGWVQSPDWPHLNFSLLKNYSPEQLNR